MVLGIDTNYATPYHPRTNGQVERFNMTLVKQLRHYEIEHVVTWSRYLSLVVTAYNSQVHGSTGQVPFAFVSPRRLSPVAIERLSKDRDAGEVVSPRQATEKFLQRLNSLVPLVRETMEKAQARYMRAFDKRVQARRQPLRVGDWVYVKSHENQGGKLVFKTLAPYQVLKTDGRRLTIESDHGIRTINGNHATRRSGPRTVVNSTSVFACFEPLGGPCSCLKKQNSCAKNRPTPLDRLSEAIQCEVLAYLCFGEQESCLTPHIAPASRAIDASPCPSLSRRVKCILLMLCLSFYERRCIYPGEQMILAPFLEKTSLDRAPGRFADCLFVPKHAKADVLLTTFLGPLRGPRNPRRVTQPGPGPWPHGVFRPSPRRLVNR